MRHDGRADRRYRFEAVAGPLEPGPRQTALLVGLIRHPKPRLARLEYAARRHLVAVASIRRGRLDPERRRRQHPQSRRDEPARSSSPSLHRFLPRSRVRRRNVYTISAGEGCAQATERRDPELTESELIFPIEKTLSRSTDLRPLDPDEGREVEQAFSG